MKRISILGLVLACLVASGCTMTSRATNSSYNGLKDFNGNEVTHVSTTNVAVHVMFKDPIWGDATLQQTMSDFTKEAKIGGASQVRVVQSAATIYWWILPPISFFIHPVVQNVAGDVR